MGNYLKAKKGIYKIPLIERICRIVQGFSKYSFYRDINGTGILIKSNQPESEISNDLVLRHLLALESTYCLVQADNITEAVKFFYENWEGAKVGKENKALYISNNAMDIIRGYPKCSYMYINKKTDQPYCGNPDHRTYSQGCILEQYDPPEYCPYDNLDAKIFDMDVKHSEIIIDNVTYRYYDFNTVRHFEQKNTDTAIYEGF